MAHNRPASWHRSKRHLLVWLVSGCLVCEIELSILGSSSPLILSLTLVLSCVQLRPCETVTAAGPWLLLPFARRKEIEKVEGGENRDGAERRESMETLTRAKSGIPLKENLVFELRLAQFDIQYGKVC